MVQIEEKWGTKMQNEKVKSKNEFLTWPNMALT